MSGALVPGVRLLGERCICCLLVAMIKHHDQRHLKEESLFLLTVEER